MTDILQTALLKCILFNEKYRVSITVTLMFVPKDPQKINTGSGNGTALNGRQALICNNVDKDVSGH